MPISPSLEFPSPGFEARKIDDEKAIDEAKYKARTSKDKEILGVLRTLDSFIDLANLTSIRDSNWKTLGEGRRQCQLEVEFALEPDHLSDAAKEMATKKLCLTKEYYMVRH